MVPQGVTFGSRRLSQHVKGIGVASPGHPLAACYGFCNVPTENELRAHFGHGLSHGFSDHRLPQATYQRVERSHNPGTIVIEDAAGQHQRPGRRVDENGTRIADMRRPVVRSDLVADQFVDSQGVRDAQHGLGQTHERNAFVSRESVLGKKRLHRSGLAFRPNGPDKRCGAFRDRLPIFRIESRCRDKVSAKRRLVGQIGKSDGFADHRPLPSVHPAHLDPASAQGGDDALLSSHVAFTAHIKAARPAPRVQPGRKPATA